MKFPDDEFREFMYRIKCEEISWGMSNSVDTGSVNSSVRDRQSKAKKRLGNSGYPVILSD